MPGQNFPYGLKLGSTTASNPGAGYLRWSGSSIQVYDGATWSSVGSDLTGYAKLDGSNQPFTGNVRIEPTSGTSLELKGSTSNNTTKALSVKDSSNVEYFYLRNDKTAWVGGLLSISGTAQNLLTVAKGIKIGNNTNTAAVATAGSIKYASGVYASDGATWNKLLESADLSGYALLDGTNQPFTGNVRIEPTSGTSLELKGSTSDNTTKALSVKDSSNVEYFYLRNDRTMRLNGDRFEQYGSSATFFTDLTPSPTWAAFGLKDTSNNNAYSVSRNPVNGWIYIGAAGLIIHSTPNRFILDGTTNFMSASSIDRFVINHLTGALTSTGTAQNLLTVANGIKIGNNTDTAATAGAGSLRYNSGFQYSNGSNWRYFQSEGYDTNILGVTASLYSITNTDYILFATASTTLTLPLISSVGIGKTYKIHARNTTIGINRSGSDLIDGATFSSLTGYSMLTLRALQSGDWSIGD